MIIQPIDYFLVAWFIAAAISTAYVAWDQYQNNPEPTVMKWGFILVTLYMGPLGLLIYVLVDKEPRPGTHEKFVEPLWKQGVGSTIHCVAGDATGIILAAVITALLGLPMIVDFVVEYVAGFAFGLFIFQTLFMMSVMGGSYWANLRKSFIPEFISMNAMMSGMLPVMAFYMMGRDMRAMEPTELVFWGVMSLGVIVGFITAYPVNVWLVAKGMKHGLMTERDEDMDKEESSASDHQQAASGSHAGHGQKDSHQGHGSSDDGDDGDKDHEVKLGPAFQPTFAQVTALSVTTSLAVLSAIVVPGFYVNIWLGPDDVGGLVMPPQMIMDFDTPADAMRDMAAVHPREVGFRAPETAKGDQTMIPRLEGGIKVFDLTSSVIQWNILEGEYAETVDAMAYNNQVPGPRIEINQGDRIRINYTNNLPEPSTIHWHGLDIPNEMDGPAIVVQDPVQPGESFVYEYTVEQYGTYFYHTHTSSDRQQALGLYGALIVNPADEADVIEADLDVTLQIQEWLKREWLTYPAMIMEGALPNFFTLNGKAYPSTDVIRMKVGQKVRIRFIGSNNNFIHPMHVHGGPYTVVAIDGEALDRSNWYEADSVSVGPGQRVDVIWEARRPGKWLIHCHIPHHTTNNNVEVEGAGGLTTYIEVSI